MDVQKLRVLAVVVVIFLCTFAGLSYVRRLKIQQVLDVEEGHPSSPQAYMADVFWSHCGMDLINMNKAIEGLEQCKPGETNCAIQKFDSEIIRKATKFLHPSMKESLRDCIIRKNLQSLVPGDEGQSVNWYFKYFESVLPVSDFPRRFLASEPAGSPSAPPSASAPFSPEFPPSASTPFSPEFPPSGPPPSPESSPSISPSSLPPSKDPSVPIPPTVNAPTSSKVGTGKSSGTLKAVAIAVGVTIPATLFITALVILCCLKLCGFALKRKDGTQNPSIVVSSISKDKHSGRVANQVILDSSSAGDLYPHSQTEREIDDQSSGFRYTKLPAVSHETSSSIAASKPSPPPPPPPSPLMSVPLSLIPKPPTPPPPPMVTPPRSSAPPPPPPMVTFAAVHKPPAPRPPPVVATVTAAPKPPPPPMAATAPRPPPPPMVAAAPKPPGPPGAPPKPPAGPHPPVPPRSGPAPPRPPPSTSSGPRPPLAPGHSNGLESEPSAPKTKLKPFFWDKVNANSESSMVWSQIKAGSFQFDEEMIESLFGSANVDKNKNEHKSESAAKDPPIHYIKLIDSRKAQNISILLKAINLTTEEVQDALLEGYELPTELLQTLLKMAPTKEEEVKLRTFSGDISLLGPAERFLKALVDIPFAFKRIESLIFATSIQEDVSSTKESFATIEVACKELRSSRLFFKLLEAVLKTGNRMNDGTFRGSAQAFKLETLLKLADVKGTDGKTTLLHFVVQEIIRSEGIKAARAARGAESSSCINLENDNEASVDNTEDQLRRLGLEAVSHLSSELENVKKAAAIDANGLAESVTKLTNSLNKTHAFLDSDMKNLTEESGFHQTLKDLVQNAEVDVLWLVDEEKRIMALVKSTGNYFHGSTGKDEGLQLFGIVRDFLIMVDKVCNEVKSNQSKPVKVRTPTSSVSSTTPDQIQQEPAAVLDMRQRLFPAIADRRVDSFSSDDEA